MPEGRWLAFVLSHPFRTERGTDGAPSSAVGVEKEGGHPPLTTRFGGGRSENHIRCIDCHFLASWMQEECAGNFQESGTIFGSGNAEVAREGGKTDGGCE